MPTNPKELDELAKGLEAKALDEAEQLSEGWRGFVWALCHPFRFGRLFGRVTAYSDAARYLRDHIGGDR